MGVRYRNKGTCHKFEEHSYDVKANVVRKEDAAGSTRAKKCVTTVVFCTAIAAIWLMHVPKVVCYVPPDSASSPHSDSSSYDTAAAVLHRSDQVNIIFTKHGAPSGSACYWNWNDYSLKIGAPDNCDFNALFNVTANDTGWQFRLRDKTLQEFILGVDTNGPEFRFTTVPQPQPGVVTTFQVKYDQSEVYSWIFFRYPTSKNAYFWVPQPESMEVIIEAQEQSNPYNEFSVQHAQCATNSIIN